MNQNSNTPAVTLDQQREANKPKVQTVDEAFNNLQKDQTLVVEFDQTLQQVDVKAHVVASDNTDRKFWRSLGDNCMIVEGSKKPSQKDFTLSVLALSNPSLGKRRRAQAISWIDGGYKGPLKMSDPITRTKSPGKNLAGITEPGETSQD